MRLEKFASGPRVVSVVQRGVGRAISESRVGTVWLPDP